MKNKKLGVALVAIMVLIVTIILIALFNNGNDKKQSTISTDFILDTSSKYIVTTDSKYRTMRNDGGSHTNVYYEIDFSNNQVTKCQDKYVGFKGYEYKGKIIYSKVLNQSEANSLRTLINDVISKKDEEKDLSVSNYMYYTLSTIEYEDIIFNDLSVIKKFESLVKE